MIPWSIKSLIMPVICHGILPASIIKAIPCNRKNMNEFQDRPDNSIVSTRRLKADQLSYEYRRQNFRKTVFVIVLVPVLILLVVAGIQIGSADISVPGVFSTIFHKFWPEVFESVSKNADKIVWELRLPRTLMALLAGIGLAGSGCVMQSTLKNPLADPLLLGISSAAGFGATLAIIYGKGFFSGTWAVITNAFAFSILVTLVIIGLSSFRGSKPGTMLLVGLAMTYLFMSLTQLVQFWAEAEAAKASMMWMVGDLAGSDWKELAILLPVEIICFSLLFWKSWDMNILGTGDEAAKSLGIKVSKLRIFLMLTASLLVAVSVSFIGVIAFIGLISPHIARIIIGNDSRYLIPASALIGGLVLLGSDCAARILISHVIIPPGVITGLLGAPFFIQLVLRQRRELF
jgi:iron complex transport system permease protein